MSNDMAHARALKPCPKCGREVTSNNLSRHIATHTNGSKAATNGHKKPGPKAESKAGRQATMAVGRYLDEVAEGGGITGYVALGAMKGYPAQTNDPDVVDAAAAAIEQRALEASTRVVELKLRQRAANLRDAAAGLREVDEGEDAEAEFVAVAAAWAEHNGITYSTFHEMGVPARVLKEAGVGR